VLSNGDKMPGDLAKAVNHWMSNPANIAALYHQLRTIDLAGYDPYDEPIKTTAKARMATETMSDLEQAIVIAISELKTPVVTIPVLTKLVETAAKENSLHLPGMTSTEREAYVKKTARKRLHNLPDVRVMIGGSRHYVHATSAADAKKYAAMETSFITRDIKRNLDSAGPSAVDKLAELHNLKGE